MNKNQLDSIKIQKDFKSKFGEINLEGQQLKNMCSKSLNSPSKEMSKK
jgi:hypothetical protein